MTLKHIFQYNDEHENQQELPPKQLHHSSMRSLDGCSLLHGLGRSSVLQSYGASQHIKSLTSEIGQLGIHQHQEHNGVSIMSPRLGQNTLMFNENNQSMLGPTQNRHNDTVRVFSLTEYLKAPHRPNHTSHTNENETEDRMRVLIGPTNASTNLDEGYDRCTQAVSEGESIEDYDDSDFEESLSDTRDDTSDSSSEYHQPSRFEGEGELRDNNESGSDCGIFGYSSEDDSEYSSNDDFFSSNDEYTE